jgi:pectin methylesterase-like acyl-CoA thioesterase
VNRLLSGVAAAVITSSAGAQTTWYVDDDSCPGPGSGTPGDPYCSIQTAIDAAAGVGDEIVVAPGTYSEAIDLFGKAVNLHSSVGPDDTTIDATGLGASVVKCITGERC